MKKENNDRLYPMKIYHYEDKRLKQKDVKSLNRHLNSIGCKLNAVFTLDTEITGIETGENRLDVNVIEEDGTIAIIEGQHGKPSEGEISKLMLYATKVNNKMDEITEKLEKINSNVIPNGRIRKIMSINRPKEELKDIIRSLNWEDERSRIEVYSPYSINGDEKLEEIINKVKQKQQLTEDDYEFLDYAIHTNFKITNHEMLKKSIQNTGTNRTNKTTKRILHKSTPTRRTTIRKQKTPKRNTKGDKHEHRLHRTSKQRHIRPRTKRREKRKNRRHGKCNESRRNIRTNDRKCAKKNRKR